MVALSAVLWLAGPPVPWMTAASADSAPEYEVKSAMLANFAKFVEWPEATFANAQAPVVIAVVGRDPCGRQLDDSVRDKTAGGRPIIVRRWDKLPAKEPVHMVFLARSEGKRLIEVLEATSGRAALTVSDLDGFARSGGMIELRLRDQRVGFEANVPAVQRAGLRISSRLLKLAWAPVPESGGGVSK